MQEETKPSVNRRGLLRRAGTVAVGVGAVGVAGAVTASPAQAADGATLVQGVNSVSPTTFTGGTASTTPLTLTNTSGAPLTLTPREPVSTAPVGSVFTDAYGSLYGVGNLHSDGEGGSTPGTSYVTSVYDDTWATSTVPLPAYHWVDTRGGNAASGSGPDLRWNRFWVVPNSATYDSSGRVMPKGNANVPDMRVDLSALVSPNGGIAAVQANLTAAKALAAGWLSVYPTSGGSSGLNFPVSTAISNFVQVVLDDDAILNVRLLKPAQVIIDVVGFVLSNQLTQLFPDDAQAVSAPGLRAAKPYLAQLKAQHARRFR